MWKDPIVEEIRKFRDEYASQRNHDIDAIFVDIQQRQAESLHALWAKTLRGS